MRVRIDGVGLIAPGLPDWESGKPVLLGEVPYCAEALPKLTASQLPAAERRRATLVTRLALEIAMQAIPESVHASDMATVFASSGGEVEVIDHIFAELATAERQLSPTLFHNSVHNAASGYWSIATGSRQASTSVAAFDDTFAIGLLEAALQAHVEGVPVLLVCYDFPPVGPLCAHRPLSSPFGVSLLLSAESQGNSTFTLEIAWTHEDSRTPASVMSDPALEALRIGNPAARSLPLLRALADRKSADVSIDLSDGRRLSTRLYVC